jgi:hypothetical protein
MADDSTTLRTTKERLAELSYRSKDRESYDDTIARLLQETEKIVSLEEAINACFEQFDNVASVRVSHPRLVSEDDLSGLVITIYTGEAESFEHSFEPLSVDHKVVINYGNGDQSRPLSYECFATFDGPQTMDNREQTVVYMDDSVLNAEPLSLDEGLEKLRTKLSDQSS